VSIDAQPSSAASSHKVTIHYQRYDDAYSPWNVWLWCDGSNGAAYEFTKVGENYAVDDFGAYGTWDINCTNPTDKVGFIIRTESWAKDPDSDRFIEPTLFKTVDGVSTAEIWVRSGSKFIWTKEPSNQPSLLGAQITALRTIKLTFDNSFTLDAAAQSNFVLKDNAGNNVEVESWGPLKGSAAVGFFTTVTLAADVKIGTSYSISHPTYGTIESDLGSLWTTPAFNDQFYYSGSDLGNTYSPTSTKFRVWAPTADSLELVTYESASAEASTATVYPMTKDVKGTWLHTLSGNQDGTIYMYRARFGVKVNEAIDPYVRAATINGDRGVVVDLDSTDPSGWATSKRPNNMQTGNPTDAIIYELHVRDLSMDASSGIPTANKGKYLAFTNLNTRFKRGTKSTLTGLSSIKDLGVTHIELLPVYDFGSVDETGAGPQFNWGYDPKNYNVPEGSYSTEPGKPKTRITELKKAIMAIHASGLRVNMDVVYNHVMDSSGFSFEKLVPGYWYRRDSAGLKTSASGCGNDTATENPMVSKYIQDSVNFWATEYKMDGFRFDLMGLMDIDTMNAIRTQLNAIDPTILMIGEGWDQPGLPADKKANTKNSAKMPGIGTFNATIRDGMKGSIMNDGDIGWISGGFAGYSGVKTGLSGNVIDFSSTPVAGIQPGQTVNYIESHDNGTFRDRLRLSMGTDIPMKTIAQTSKIGNALLFLAQGVPFIQAGQEFLRSKNFKTNSYNLSDEINSLKWGDRITYAENVTYLKNMIKIRKAHKAFRMPTAAAITRNFKFLTAKPYHQIGFMINGKAVGDKWGSIVVLANSDPYNTAKISVPVGTYKVVADGKTVADTDSKGVTKTLRTLKSTGTVVVPPLSLLVMYR
jgi:pullulanase